MNLLTPKMAAEMLGISESTVRRLCDSGKLEFHKTGGSHRRITFEALRDYAEKSNISIRYDKTIAAGGGGRVVGGPIIVKRFLQHAKENQSVELFEAVRDLYRREWSIAKILDEVVGPVLFEIGRQWHAQETTVEEEHRVTAICMQVVSYLRFLLPKASDKKNVVVTGALENDPYLIPTTMVEVSFLDAGYTVIPLGANCPAEHIATTIERERPSLVAISVTAHSKNLKEQLQILRNAMSESALLAVGGFAAEGPNLEVDFYGTSLQKLTEFAETRL